MMVLVGLTRYGLCPDLVSPLALSVHPRGGLMATAYHTILGILVASVQ